MKWEVGRAFEGVMRMHRLHGNSRSAHCERGRTNGVGKLKLHCDKVNRLSSSLGCQAH